MLYRHEAMPNFSQWRRAIGMSTIMIVISMGGTAIAQQSISSSLAAIIAATIPAWTALFVGFMGQWSHRREWFGIGLGFIGIILINVYNIGSSNFFGITLMTFVAMSWAFGTALKSRQKTQSTLADSMAEMVCGGALLFVLSALRGEHIIGTPTLNATMGLLYMTLFGSSLVYVAYIYLVQNVRPSIATSNAYVNPAIAVLLGLYIGEVIGFTTWIALGLIIASVLVLLREKQAN
jgi:drug/metabolite transporter (DMT)-like permease